MATATYFACLLLISSALIGFSFSVIQAQSRPPIVNGLSWTFYQTTCPQLESIIRRELQQVFATNIGQAAGLLRLQFHDCFVQGCDGSILLERGSERTEIPNRTLRPEAFQILENLRQIVHAQCGRVVSCSDILTIAARDSVVLSGGPDYEVPLGRRDGVTLAPVNQTFIDLIPATANVSTIISQFSRKNLNVTDVVALSGAHTIGISSCSSFTNRLYPTIDPTMDPAFAASLMQICPSLDSTNVAVLDVRSPNTFDNQYYANLFSRQGLLNSDQNIRRDARTLGYVTRFFTNQTFFFRMFVDSMVKMGQVDVLTGTQGEIRANCFRRNSDNLDLLPVAKENLGSSSTMR